MADNSFLKGFAQTFHPNWGVLFYELLRGQREKEEQQNKVNVSDQKSAYNNQLFAKLVAGGENVPKPMPLRTELKPTVYPTEYEFKKYTPEQITSGLGQLPRDYQLLYKDQLKWNEPKLPPKPIVRTTKEGDIVQIPYDPQKGSYGEPSLIVPREEKQVDFYDWNRTKTVNGKTIVPYGHTEKNEKGEDVWIEKNFKIISPTKNVNGTNLMSTGLKGVYEYKFKEMNDADPTMRQDIQNQYVQLVKNNMPVIAENEYRNMYNSEIKDDNGNVIKPKNTNPNPETYWYNVLSKYYNGEWKDDPKTKVDESYLQLQHLYEMFRASYGFDPAVKYGLSIKEE